MCAADDEKGGYLYSEDPARVAGIAERGLEVMDDSFSVISLALLFGSMLAGLRTLESGLAQGLLE